MTMVERVARAICGTYGDDYDEQPVNIEALRAERSRQRGGKPFRLTPFGPEYPPEAIFGHDPGLPTQEDWRKCARAALVAMLEPTDAMIEAGCSAPTFTLADEWRVMVEAALKE